MHLTLGDGGHYFKELVESKYHKCRYLSESIQNEIIKILGNAARLKLVAELKTVPSFTIISETTEELNSTENVNNSSEINVINEFMDSVVSDSDNSDNTGMNSRT